MFNKCAWAMTGLMVAFSSVGCCLHGYGYNANRYNYNQGGCPCATPPYGGQPVGTQYMPSASQIYTGDVGSTAYVPGMTTTAALPPGATLGAPIYSAAVPINSLPPY